MKGQPSPYGALVHLSNWVRGQSWLSRRRTLRVLGPIFVCCGLTRCNGALVATVAVHSPLIFPLRAHCASRGFETPAGSAWRAVQLGAQVASSNRNFLDAI